MVNLNICAYIIIPKVPMTKCLTTYILIKVKGTRVLTFMNNTKSPPVALALSETNTFAGTPFCF